MTPRCGSRERCLHSRGFSGHVRHFSQTVLPCRTSKYGCKGEWNRRLICLEMLRQTFTIHIHTENNRNGTCPYTCLRNECQVVDCSVYRAMRLVNWPSKGLDPWPVIKGGMYLKNHEYLSIPWSTSRITCKYWIYLFILHIKHEIRFTKSPLKTDTDSNGQLGK